MKEIKTAAIMGMGAVGAAYAAMMAKNIAPDNIFIIASGARAARYREQGVFVNGERYIFPVLDEKEKTQAVDLIIFAVKYYQLPQAVADAQCHIGKETIILSLLNGISSENDIARICGSCHVIPASVIKISAVRRAGEISFSTAAVVQFGEAASAEPGDVERLKEFFSRAGIAYEIHSDMKLTLWRKFMINVGMNQTTAVLRFTYGMMQTNAEARAIMVSAMEEVIAVGRYEGATLDHSDMDIILKRMDSFPADGKTSMLQDIESFRQTEVSMLGEEVVRLGRVHAVPTPVNEMLSRLIRAETLSYMPNIAS